MIQYAMLFLFISSLVHCILVHCVYPEGSTAFTLKGPLRFGPLRFGPLRLPREPYQIRTYTETRALASRHAN